MHSGRQRVKGSRSRLRVVLIAFGVAAFALIAWLSNDMSSLKGMTASQHSKTAVGKPEEPLEVRGENRLCIRLLFSCRSPCRARLSSSICRTRVKQVQVHLQRAICGSRADALSSCPHTLDVTARLLLASSNEFMLKTCYGLVVSDTKITYHSDLSHALWLHKAEDALASLLQAQAGVSANGCLTCLFGSATASSSGR